MYYLSSNERKYYVKDDIASFVKTIEEHNIDVQLLRSRFRLVPIK